MSIQQSPKWALLASKIVFIIFFIFLSVPAEGQPSRLVAKINIFSFSELTPSGETPTNCAASVTPASVAAAIPNEVRDDLDCIWYNSDGPNEELWADTWNNGGKCAGMGISDYFRLVADIYRKYNPNALMSQSGFKPPSVDRDAFLASISASIGKTARIYCDPKNGLLTLVGVCLSSSYPYDLIDCPYDASIDSDCFGTLQLPTVSPGTVPEECSFYIPTTWSTVPPSPQLISPPTPIVTPTPTPTPTPVPDPPIVVPSPPLKGPADDKGRELAVPPPPSDSGGGGISIGAIVGIVVGCIVLAAVGLAGYMYVRKKKNAAGEGTINGMPAGGPMPPPYVVVDNTGGPRYATSPPMNTRGYDSQLSQQNSQQGYNSGSSMLPMAGGVGVGLAAGAAGVAYMAPSQSAQFRSYPISETSPPSTPASPYTQGSFGAVSTRRSAPSGLASDPLMQYIASNISNASGGSRGPLAAWQLRFEDLQIERPIGEGSFGRVYKASWNQTQVAVKVLLEGETGSETSLLQASSPIMARLEQEASLMSNLHHPNVVQFLGVCTFPAAVVTEFCARGSLTSVLQAAAKSPEAAANLSWPRRIGIAADTARGMIYLHTHTPPILHRDLKSANLLVTASWVVKVTDFNLSKIMAESSKATSNQAMNPRWLAPEVLMGGGATLASDVYSYGVVLWELLTWQLPWGAANPWGIVSTITSGGRLPFPAPVDLPGEGSGDWPKLGQYVALLQRCWAQEPSERPTFQEIIQELRSIDPQATDEEV